jgi:hypothetical protein
VRVIHVAANNFQRVSPIGNPSFAGGPLVSWPLQRAQLARTLVALDAAVIAGKNEFPTPIRLRLATVDTNIRAGEVQLLQARNIFDLSSRVSSIFPNGQTALGEASELVGHACGVRLAADPVS